MGCVGIHQQVTLVAQRDEACTQWASGWLAFQRRAAIAYPGLDFNLDIPSDEEAKESLSADYSGEPDTPAEAHSVTPQTRESVDYTSTCGNSICLVSRDSYLSKNAYWAHKPILIKTKITTILQLSPNNSTADYTFIQTYIKIYNSNTCYVQKPSKPQTGFFKISL